MSHRRRALTILILVSITLISCGICVSAATVGDYNRTLARLSSGLDSAVRMEKQRPGSGRPALEQIIKSTPPSMSIKIEGERSIPADLRWITSDIRDIVEANPKTRQAKLTELAERVRIAAQAQSETGNGSAASTVQARSTLKRILARSEYKPSIKGDIMARVMDAIARAFDRIKQLIPSGTWGFVSRAVTIFAVLLFAVSLVYAALKLVNRRSGRTVMERPTREKLQHKTKRPSPESLLEAAEADAAGNRYREAFRSVYLAAILLLDRSQLINYADGTTNWEYMRVLRRQASADQTRIFGDMTLLFDQSVYGHHDVSQDDYLSSRTQFRQLEATL